MKAVKVKAIFKLQPDVLKFLFLLISIVLICAPDAILAQDNDECMMCHNDKTLTKKIGTRSLSLFVDEKKIGNSAHASLQCISCHSDLKGADIPHEENLQKVNCGSCHKGQQTLYESCLHGKAKGRGDALAPTCKSCHGTHEILSSKNLRSITNPLQVPVLCGKCHREGSPVQRQRNIHQDMILENYGESIHGEGLLRKGLIVSATCTSCHTAHQILPHTDSRSTIARRNIAQTCAKCHVQIEEVHRKVIKGELWEKELHTLPACVDCHQPHKVRKVFYDQGMADRDCLRCHEKENLKAKDGRSMLVKTDDLAHSAHIKTACSQCHAGVTPSKLRPCETIVQKVDCGFCHTEVVSEYQKSFHGKLFAKNDPNAPSCLECHGTHNIRGKRDSKSVIFPTNIPSLCGKCHREGEKAAVRYKGSEHEIIDHYVESIHGKGLMKSGLLVTAVCTDCHTSHSELPASDDSSSVNRKNISKTCGTCHHGIEEQFDKSIHSTLVSGVEKKLPVCSDCHSAHKIIRADSKGFKLTIMNQCGKCHEEIAKTYFDTYHGKVSQLGYTKTAKCYDCHGSHDILPVSNQNSHLSRENVVKTCQKCHPGATRKFAGYLTHATHHDPDKYPFLFWAFWGMTGLLIFTFVLSGLHTVLWLSRSLKWRRELNYRNNKNSE